MNIFDTAMAKMDANLLKAFGTYVTLILAGEEKTIKASIDSDLHVGSSSGGFTNRYNNRSDDVIANRWMAIFQKSDLNGEHLDGVVITTLSGQKYELQEIIDEDAGLITYGAAKF